jgi:hypothetical protein
MCTRVFSGLDAVGRTCRPKGRIPQLFTWVPRKGRWEGILGRAFDFFVFLKCLSWERKGGVQAFSQLLKSIVGSSEHASLKRNFQTGLARHLWCISLQKWALAFRIGVVMTFLILFDSELIMGSWSRRALQSEIRNFGESAGASFYGSCTASTRERSARLFAARLCRKQSGLSSLPQNLLLALP